MLGRPCKTVPRVQEIIRERGVRENFRHSSEDRQLIDRTVRHVRTDR